MFVVLSISVNRQRYGSCYGNELTKYNFDEHYVFLSNPFMFIFFQKEIRFWKLKIISLTPTLAIMRDIIRHITSIYQQHLAVSAFNEQDYSR